MASYGPERFVCRDGRELILRNPETVDLDSFFAFHRQVSSETQFTLQMAELAPKRDALELRWRGWAESLEDFRVSAFAGSAMVGQLGFHLEHPNHPWVKHVGRFGMMILQEYWGQGLGRHMIGLMETHARRTGISRIEATVRAGNTRGLALYQGCGFKVEGRRERAALIDGAYQDEFFIAKLL